MGGCGTREVRIGASESRERLKSTSICLATRREAKFHIHEEKPNVEYEGSVTSIMRKITKTCEGNKTRETNDRKEEM